MLSISTRNVIEAAVKSDAAMSEEERDAFMRLLKGSPAKTILISSKAACEILDISKVTLWQYAKQGRLRQIHQSKRRVRYDKAEVEELAYRGI